MTLKDLKSELLLLKHELHQVRLENQTLKLENQRLLTEMQVMISENKALTQELATLKDKLNINSSNSGLPTSKEIYKIERQSRPKSERKPGGQKGQAPRFYQFRTPDQVITVPPEEKTCACGEELTISDEYQAHQKIEIPPINPFVTEYRLHSASCKVCSRRYKSRLRDYKLLGKNAETIITSLGGFFNNSKREIQAILSQMFNLDISLGLISNSEARVSNVLATEYDKLLEQAAGSHYLHLDETSANKQGKRMVLGCWE
jgi:hypothetical protein